MLRTVFDRHRRAVAAKRFSRLANSSDSSVRAALASRPDAPSAVLRKLSGDRDRYVRASVASNTATPHDILRRLASDSAQLVRECLAENECTPAHLLAVLANDPESIVRQRVASRADVPDHILDQLAGDADAYVRRAVLANPATSSATRLLAAAVGHLADDRYHHGGRWTVDRLRSEIQNLTADQMSVGNDLIEGWQGNLDQFFATI